MGAVVPVFLFLMALVLLPFLICTFFFVVGVNLLFRQKVFFHLAKPEICYRSVYWSCLFHWLLFLANSGFPFGGAVGDMVCGKLTGRPWYYWNCCSFAIAGSWIFYYWQFNPAFNFPSKTAASSSESWMK
jgi:S-DNA-T family DNA segregation ATPase FtsK/SpoIIIE